MTDATLADMTNFIALRKLRAQDQKRADARAKARAKAGKH